MGLPLAQFARLSLRAGSAIIRRKLPVARVARGGQHGDMSQRLAASEFGKRSHEILQRVCEGRRKKRKRIELLGSMLCRGRIQ